jgi:hypothetical protein
MVLAGDRQAGFRLALFAFFDSALIFMRSGYMAFILEYWRYAASLYQ